MLQVIEMCSACDKNMGAWIGEIHHESNDPFAYQVHITICGECRNNWSEAKIGKIRHELTKSCEGAFTVKVPVQAPVAPPNLAQEPTKVWAIGDVVVMKSDYGPRMTVLGIENAWLTCGWFDDNDVFHKESLHSLAVMEIKG